MRNILAAVALAWVATPAAAAPAVAEAEAPRGVEDPRVFVAETYEAYRNAEDAGPEWPAFAYSPRLRARFDAYDSWTAGEDGLIGALDFDWWVNGQDWELGPVELAEEAVGPDRRTVVARFSNGGSPNVNRFRFVREGGRWFLDDVVSGDGGEDGWVLSELLSERP